MVELALELDKLGKARENSFMTPEEIKALSVDQKKIYFAHSFSRSLAGSPPTDTEFDFIKNLTVEEAKKQADILDETAQKLARISHASSG